MKSIITYVKEAFDELKNKVSWVSWSEAQRTTVVVSVFTVIFAIAVLFVDKTFQSVLTKFFEFVK